MPDTVFIGDTHFGHKNIITFDATKPFRPFATIEEHDEEIVRRWNSVVGKKDIVWHLGDFAFGRKSIEIGARLNGVKKLVLGNHDTYPSLLYLKHFHKLYGAVAYGSMLLTHVPVVADQLIRFGDKAINVHGHLHTKRIDDPRYRNASCEQINLTPIAFEEIRA